MAPLCALLLAGPFFLFWAWSIEMGRQAGTLGRTAAAEQSSALSLALTVFLAMTALSACVPWRRRHAPLRWLVALAALLAVPGTLALV
ncbi:hypothetical protein [Streptomyces sp. NPDC048172]|uniref:hypothetical protein n=1 Tax=Streptomyces sp. NPDC048172 TaxID=3365505 RepID=UPI0037199ABF